MKHDDRLHALKILSSLIQDKKSLNQLMSLSLDVSSMTKELCFGFCRHYFRLEVIANCLLDKKPKGTEIWVALLMGLYQLHYMDKPDYAVVKETVALLEKIKKTWARGLVNAVLRTFCRQKNEIIARLDNDPTFKYGQPEWLLERLKVDWPFDWEAIALANDKHPPMTLRVNQSKKSVEEYLQALTESGIEAYAHPVASEGITLVTPCDVNKLPGFSKGWVSIQDGAAQLAVSLLSLQAGQRVLDACCAPGGKTCHILESQPDLATCLAVDVDSRRLQRVKENLDRLQLQATLITGDALTPEQWWDGQLFDRILLDAPCSATGVIRRHADIKLLRTPLEVSEIIKIQSALLTSLWPMLEPGGIMVYATCSILAVENELQIAHFLQHHNDCTVYKSPRSWGTVTPYGQQILPGEQGMDGFFYSVLMKNMKQ